LAASFETHRFAMLLRMRPEILMVRSATSRVSNHEATGAGAMTQRIGKCLGCVGVKACPPHILKAASIDEFAVPNP
jgi:hypothetical protein